MIDRTPRAEGSDGWTRRRLLQASVAGATAIGVAETAAAQETTEVEETQGEPTTVTEDGTTGTGVDTTFELGARTDGWEGQSPERIADETNPTLSLTTGTDYEVVWENLDGEEHDFVLRDDAGSEIDGTDSIDAEGETTSLSFTATEEMARYVCTFHQDSMSGEVVLTDEGETPGGGRDTDEPVTTVENGTDNEIAAGTPGQQEQTTIVGPDQGESPGEQGDGAVDGTETPSTDQPGFGTLAALAALAAVVTSRFLGEGDCDR